MSRHWTPEEEAIVIHAAGIRTLGQVATQLGRSTRSVQLKARELNVSYNRRGELHPKAIHPDKTVIIAYRLYWGKQWTARQIGEYFDVPESTVYGWISGTCRTYALEKEIFVDTSYFVAKASMRRDIKHACETLVSMGVPDEQAQELQKKLRGIIDDVLELNRPSTLDKPYIQDDNE